MIPRLILSLILRRVIRLVADRHGGVAGAAVGAALASRKTRALGLGGAAALTAYEMIRERRAQRRLPAPTRAPAPRLSRPSSPAR